MNKPILLFSALPVVVSIAAAQNAVGPGVGQAADPRLRWTRSLQLPLIDVNGKILTGTEVMELAVHKGSIYAGNSQWNVESPKPPTQVFVLNDAGNQWKVDLDLAPEYTRTTYLKFFTFRTDGAGRPIEPHTALVLGVNRERVTGAQTPAVVFIRDDDTGAWIEQTICMSDTDKWAVGVRSMGFHRDKMTSVDMAFLGVGPGAGIYTGTFNETVPGRIQWSDEPEFRPIQTQRSPPRT